MNAILLAFGKLVCGVTRRHQRGRMVKEDNGSRIVRCPRRGGNERSYKQKPKVTA